jgi:magnesium chelatase family protein
VDRPGPDPFSLADLERARERQAGRFPPEATARAWNARLPPAALPDAAAPDRQARDHLVRLAREQGLSGRGVHRLLRVARTIADLRGAETVEVRDVCEAQALRA